MAIKIIQDKKQNKISKKKKSVKPVKKVSDKKAKTKSGYTVRNTSLAIPKINDIRVIKRTKKKSSIKKFIGKIFMLLFVVSLSFSSVYAYNHLMSYLSSLERFFIDDIEVTGCKNVTPSEIINLIPFKVGETSIGINLWQVEKDLKESKPELKNVYAHRENWFGRGKKMKIVVSLTERLPEVFIYNKENKEGLDFDNKPFNLRGNMASMQIPFLLYKNEQEREDLLKFFKEIKVYLSDLIPEIKDIKYGEIEDVIITMNNGTIIYWGLPKYSKIEEKAEKFLAISQDLVKKKQNMDYIDLSFLDNNKDKIIVKISDVTKEGKA